MYQRIVRCLLRLSETENNELSLKEFIPKSFYEENKIIKEDKQLYKWYKQLMININQK